MSGSQRTIAWILGVATAAVIVAGLVLTFRSTSLEAWGFPGAPALWAASFLVVGWLIARAQPRNAIGWLFMAGGLLSSLMFLGASLIRSVDSSDDPSEVATLVGLVLVSLFALGLGSMIAAIVLFTTGRLETRFERFAMFVLVVFSMGLSGSFIVFALNAYLGPEVLTVDSEPTGVLEALFGFMFVGWQIASFVALLAFVLRYRRSAGVERQQLKWLAWGATVVGILAVFTQVGLDLFAGEAVYDLGSAVLAVSVLLVPLTIGIGMLRYRLFDIDRVINRTVVYAIVVVSLALVYSAAVFILRSLLPLDGDLAVVVSTLAVVALFSPVRKRVQAFVDRRFYRNRYDVRRVTEDFASRLQGEFDVDVVMEEWIAVVGQTLQPVAAGVWIRSRNDTGTAGE